jgi:uncharacterized protein with NRDE domain
MCLLAIAMGVSDRWPLVIASNRDEYRDRPTLPLAVWSTPGEVTIVSGRDLLAGGTWMGSTTGGRIALLTNVREPDATAAALSRGDLPLRWLEGQMNAAQFLADTNPTSYGGCNLLMGDFLRGEWTWASNRANVGAVPLNSQQTTSGWQTMALSPGIYGLSNALLDTPWPKTQALKAAMAGALAKADADGDTAVLANILWPALGNTERYGTRCSTLMWIAAEPNSNSFSATICEKSMTAESPKPSASDAQMVRLTWSMPV